MLQRLTDYVAEVNSETKGKLEITRKYMDLRPIFQVIYDPLTTTGITLSSLLRYKKSNKPTQQTKGQTVFTLMVALTERKLSGHDALAAVWGFVLKKPQFEKIILAIVTKNLKTRVGLTMMNKVFQDPPLCSQFSVALGMNYVKGKSNFENSMISRKYDGVRVITMVDAKQRIRCYSRTGKEFHSLEMLKNVLRTQWPSHTNLVLDGEICVVNKDGEEDFRAAVSQVKRKSQQMVNFRYFVFDCLKHSEFHSKTSTVKLTSRLKRFPQNLFPFVVLVEQVPFTPTNFQEWKNRASTLEWEGLIVRADVGYKGKRSSDVLKVKEFMDAEYIVKSISTGGVRVKNKEVQTLTSVTIVHNDIEVQVGSGFTMKERHYYYNHPENLIGRTITVQYFEETASGSLRFPTMKKVWDKNEL
jgi:DNA ligase-1